MLPNLKSPGSFSLVSDPAYAAFTRYTGSAFRIQIFIEVLYWSCPCVIFVYKGCTLLSPICAGVCLEPIGVNQQAVPSLLYVDQLVSTIQDMDMVEPLTY